jgi:hypothetical protein
MRTLSRARPGLLVPVLALAGMLTVGSLVSWGQPRRSPEPKDAAKLPPTVESLNERIIDLEKRLSELQRLAVKRPPGVSPIRPLPTDRKADEFARRGDIHGLQDQVDRLNKTVNQILSQLGLQADP